MSFFEQRLPERFSFGAQGGPNWSTEVNKTGSGQRFANGNWLMALHVFDISYGVKSESDFAAVRAFHFNVGGRRDGFRFKAWDDYQAGAGYVHPTPQPLVLVSGSIYQLTVSYVSAARTYTRPVYKPVAGLQVYRTRSGVTSSISPSIDTTTGLVTVSGHVAGDTYTWTGEFDVPVAFTSDAMNAVIQSKNGGGFLISWPSIEVEEIRIQTS